MPAGEIRERVREGVGTSLAGAVFFNYFNINAVVLCILMSFFVKRFVSQFFSSFLVQI